MLCLLPPSSSWIGSIDLKQCGGRNEGGAGNCFQRKENLSVRGKLQGSKTCGRCTTKAKAKQGRMLNQTGKWSINCCKWNGRKVSCLSKIRDDFTGQCRQRSMVFLPVCDNLRVDSHGVGGANAGLMFMMQAFWAFIREPPLLILITPLIFQYVHKAELSHILVRNLKQNYAPLCDSFFFRVKCWDGIFKVILGFWVLSLSHNTILFWKCIHLFSLTTYPIMVILL